MSTGIKPTSTLMKIILVSALLVFVIVRMGWDSWTWWRLQDPFDYGKPTLLSGDQSIRTSVCEIREELARLPHPVVDKHRYHRAWSEFKIGPGWSEHGAVYEINLAPAAHEFMLSHSRAELIAALAPLLADPTSGGRAAAILGGLPMRSKAALTNTTLLAAAVQRAQAGDPNAVILWDPEIKKHPAQHPHTTLWIDEHGYPAGTLC